MEKLIPFFLSIALLFVLYSTPEAEAFLLDFDDLQTGEIVSLQYFENYGVRVSAENFGWGPDLAIIFDSQNPTGDDYDLAGPNWKGGNLSLDNMVLGKILIVAENDFDSNLDGLIDNPDDQGSRPAGSIFFDFESNICSLGFDLIDVEGPSEFNQDSGFVATFFMDEVELVRVGFGQFINEDSLFYDRTVKFGNNYANRISPLTVDSLSEFSGSKIVTFDRVEFNLGGSSAIDNVLAIECEISSMDNYQIELSKVELEKFSLNTLDDFDSKDKVLIEWFNVFSDFGNKIQNILFESFFRINQS